MSGDAKCIILQWPEMSTNRGWSVLPETTVLISTTYTGQQFPPVSTVITSTHVKSVLGYRNKAIEPDKDAHHAFYFSANIPQL